ncbi:MAG: ASCH domain-containing protein [Planctomycetota bacterium]
MQALTIKQPWASAIAAGHKRIENRSWRPAAASLPLQFAVHAGARVDHAGITFCRDLGAPVEDLPISAILAVATVVQVLEDVVPIEPIPCAGRLSLWTPAPAIQRLLRCRLAAARRQ